MTDTSDLREVRDLPAGLTLELRAGNDPSLVLAHGDNRVLGGATSFRAIPAGAPVTLAPAGGSA